LAFLVRTDKCGDGLLQVEEKIGVDATNMPEVIPLGQRNREIPHYKEENTISEL